MVELSRILTEQQFSLIDLIDINFNADKHIAFRIACILENIYLQNAPAYQGHIGYIISRVKEVEHASYQRRYAKILIHLTSVKVIPLLIKDELQGID